MSRWGIPLIQLSIMKMAPLGISLFFKCASQRTFICEEICFIYVFLYPKIIRHRSLFPKNSSAVTVYVKPVCYHTCVSKRSYWLTGQFPLTFRGVKYKQHSAVFPDRTRFLLLTLLMKENLVWSMVTRKPRYSDQIESGALCFVPVKNAW